MRKKETHDKRKSAALGEARGVAGHEVDFEVEAIPHPSLPPGRDGQRVRDQQHRPARAFAGHDTLQHCATGNGDVDYSWRSDETAI